MLLLPRESLVQLMGVVDFHLSSRHSALCQPAWLQYA
jgi:hypothetical protein